MKTKTPDTIEQEVNAIRLKIYEETKDMTPAQLTEYYRKSGEASAKNTASKSLPVRKKINSVAFSGGHGVTALPTRGKP